MNTPSPSEMTKWRDACAQDEAIASSSVPVSIVVGDNTIVRADSLEEARALLDVLKSLAKGSYQMDLALGLKRWSGADLLGKARKWSGRYAKSRAAYLSRLESAGYPHRRQIGAHNRITMIIATHDALL